ncbi:MAG: homoserine dehydrogenase [Alphaproteobacteria bacterium]|nr:homoserine dehydrogenase [Alphaproteobacteria bacterium]
MSAPLRVGIAGLGTVGGGVVKLLRTNAEVIAARAGRRIEAVAVSARDRAKQRGFDLAGLRWESDPLALASAKDVDVVVELIGGSDGPGRKLAEAAIDAGKGVVTANKALLACRGFDLAKRAEAKKASLAIEAAVAGGIPILKALREGLAANRLARVYGILNGTCNYILTQMQGSGRDFAEVLAEAQKLGYAETDPSFDIDGVDTAHKLAVLASVAFGMPVAFDKVHVEGIRAITAADIAFAAELGFRLKLLAVARRTNHGIEQRVHPALVALDDPIAHVDGVFNAVVAEGDFVGRTVFEGRGAGEGPTASAVVADLIDIASGRGTPAFGVPASALVAQPHAPMERHVGPYYIRLTVHDRPGVIADIAAILRDEQVSIESLLQRGRAETVPVVMITHETEEAAMRRAAARIGALASVTEPPCLIRIELL